MILEELMSVIPDWQTTAVCCDNGDYVDVLAVYDGRESIPEEYNGCRVWTVFEYDGVIRVVIDKEDVI